MTKILEGLMKNDLADLVKPLLSIDEFESKIKEDAIVLAFYVTDKDPATDLNRFIQKSPVMLLDTEVSQAPNTDGEYLVFVELDRSSAFKSNLNAILEEIDTLVDIPIDGWEFTVYGYDEVFQLNEKNLDILVRTKSYDELKQDMLDESVNSFFFESKLNSVLVESDKNLFFAGSGVEVIGELEYIGEESDQTKYLGESIIDYSVGEMSVMSGIIQKMLGPEYNTFVMENKIIISGPHSRFIVLSEPKIAIPH